MENDTSFDNELYNTTLPPTGFQEESESLPMWAQIFELSYLSVVAAIGTPGNILILLVQKRNREKSSTDYLVTAMACHELLCSSINAAIKLFMHTGRIWQSFASDTFCRIHYFIMFANTLSSTYLLGAIAVDRYIKTCKPACSYYTTTTSKYACIGLSAVAFILSITTLVTYHLTDNFICAIAKDLNYIQYHNNIFVLSSIGIVGIIFVACYTSIAVTLRKRVRNRKRVLVNQQKPSINQSTSQRSASIWLVNFRRKTSVEPQSSSSHPNIKSTPEQSIPENGTLGAEFENHEKKHKIPNTRKVSNNRSNGSQNKTSRDNQKVSQVRKPNHNIAMVEQTVSRTTRIMFLISVIFVVVWTLVSLSALSNDTLLGYVIGRYSNTIFMINCITNPTVFFCMSSKYRSVAKSILCRFRRRG